MSMIVETIVVTRQVDASFRISPFGLIAEGEHWILAPFHPSPVIDNLDLHPFFSASLPQDARVFAGCVTGRKDWPLTPCADIDGARLRDADAHWELAVVEKRDDPLRPRYRCARVSGFCHRARAGFNRAEAALIEAAVLTTRLDMLPEAKIRAEMAYLSIAMRKTGGLAEREGWGWIVEKINAHFLGNGSPLLPLTP